MKYLLHELCLRIVIVSLVRNLGLTPKRTGTADKQKQLNGISSVLLLHFKYFQWLLKMV